MSQPIVIESTIDFRRSGRGRPRRFVGDSQPECSSDSGRVPRISRLMALAIRFEGLIHTGSVRDYAELARLGHVTRARITQIMNLRLLAPEIQEKLLFLPSIQQGAAPIHLRDLQKIAIEPNWHNQRRAWQELCQENGIAGS